MNRFDRFLARHPNVQAFFFGISNTFGIAPVRRHVPTVEESLQEVCDSIEDVIRRVRRGERDETEFPT